MPQAQESDNHVSLPRPPIEPKLPIVKVSPGAANLTVGDLNSTVAPNSQTNIQASPPPNQSTVPLSYYLTAEDQSYPEPPAGWATSQNFLILGTDKRPQDPIWRTDVIMVVGLDRAGQQAAILSIPRDLYIDIPGTRSNRINTVDYMGENILRVEGGGAALVSQVIRKTFGIETEHWVRVQMDGLSDIVDVLGGVTIELECPFFEPILNLDTNEWEYFTLPAGQVLLDGDDARWYARLRLRESDIGRSRRQRQLLSAIKDQVLSTNAFLRFPALWSAMSGIYETDLDLAETMDLATFALSLDTANIHTGGITGEGGAIFNDRTEQGAQVFRIGDETAIRRMVENVWFAVDSAQDEGASACQPVPTGPPGNPYGVPQVQQSQAPTQTVEASN